MSYNTKNKKNCRKQSVVIKVMLLWIITFLFLITLLIIASKNKELFLPIAFLIPLLGCVGITIFNLQRKMSLFWLITPNLPILPYATIGLPVYMYKNNMNISEFIFIFAILIFLQIFIYSFYAKIFGKFISDDQHEPDEDISLQLPQNNTLVITDHTNEGMTSRLPQSNPFNHPCNEEYTITKVQIFDNYKTF